MKLTFPLLNTTITVPVDETVTSGKVSRRSLRKKAENKAAEQIEKISETSSAEVKPADVSEKSATQKPLDSSATQSNSQPILMVEVVNVTHEKFKQTEEIKVIYNKLYYYWTATLERFAILLIKINKTDYIILSRDAQLNFLAG